MKPSLPCWRLTEPVWEQGEKAVLRDAEGDVVHEFVVGKEDEE